MPTIKLKLWLNNKTPEKKEEIIPVSENISSETPPIKKLSLKIKKDDTEAVANAPVVEAVADAPVVEAVADTPVVEAVADTPVVEAVAEVKKETKALISLSKKTNTINTKKEEPINKEKTVIDSELIKRKITPEEEIFANYDSDFHRNERTILQRIKAMRFVPKTRTSLVFGLIWMTVLTITFLWIIDPENHSLNSYKASILYAIWKKPVYIPTNSINDKSTENNSNINISNSWNIDENVWFKDEYSLTWTKISDLTNSWVTDKINNEAAIENTVEEKKDNQEVIKEKWLSVNAEIISLPNWDVVYSYNWNTYSKDWLKEVLKKEVQEKVDKKIKEHLTEIYIKK